MLQEFSFAATRISAGLPMTALHHSLFHSAKFSKVKPISPNSLKLGFLVFEGKISVQLVAHFYPSGCILEISHAPFGPRWLGVGPEPYGFPQL